MGSESRCPFGQTPHHGIMADDPARGMVHGALDGMGDAWGNIQRRFQLLDLAGSYYMTLDTIKLGRGDI